MAFAIEESRNVEPAYPTMAVHIAQTLCNQKERRNQESERQVFESDSDPGPWTVSFPADDSALTSRSIKETLKTKSHGTISMDLLTLCLIIRKSGVIIKNAIIANSFPRQAHFRRSGSEYARTFHVKAVMGLRSRNNYVRAAELTAGYIY